MRQYAIKYPAKEIDFVLDDLVTAFEVGIITAYKLEAPIPDGFIESTDVDFVSCTITCISYPATLLEVKTAVTDYVIHKGRVGKKSLSQRHIVARWTVENIINNACVYFGTKKEATEWVEKRI